ncbi:DUF2790 domain-containing protein [Pseudomonas vanderleydeniana]|uniref:DUF2790 domain-containing protein n=1 Tax=Pseudomonas vanderleydeniana TaxID=2745495 RepID=A0A9E6TTG2_9PSED|nr:DUF2790 domain-containing protein [Pseudomonas vanderleydeniana]QXI29220.1 DUF2790 domain-containing protein [Pseudomonas vanderleydeniana]
MKLKALCTAGLFSALSLLAIAAPAQAASAKPDIQHVVSITTDAMGSCGVANAHLTYLDSQGETHTLEYGKFANCNQGS